MKKSRLPGPSCSRSHWLWLPRGNASAPRENQTVLGTGVGVGSQYSLKQQRFYLPHPRRLCGAGARAHKDRPEAPQVQSQEEPARGGWAPRTPCAPRATAQEPPLPTGLPGSSRAQDPRPGPQTPPPTPLRSAGSPWRAERLTAVTTCAQPVAKAL